jgi:hypothetical protein
MNGPEELIDDLRLQEPPVPFEINWWLVAGVVAGTLALWWLIRRRMATRGQRAAAMAVQRSHEDALAALEKLFALVDREESRPYAIESSGIVRRYIETRFSLSAPRQSTEEFLESATHSPNLAPECQALLAEFLKNCDLLKFARALANRNELTRLHESAIRFVRETRSRGGLAS